MRKRLRSESGASAVEFALLLPVLVLILFGIIELGLALYQQSILTNASREGARLGIVQSIPAITSGAITTTVDTYLTSAGIIPGNVTKFITLGTVTGTPVTVRLTLPYTFVTLPGVTGMFGPAMSSALTLQAVTVMRHE